MFNPNDHMMDLKGKDYLQVMWRLVWFREEKPNWCIETKSECITPELAIFTAKIFDENGVQKSSGYGSEAPKDFKDYVEKAETKAVGRALAMMGYGTQFSPELDEGDRIVDSPVQKKKVEESKSRVDDPTPPPPAEICISKKDAEELVGICKEKWPNPAEMFSVVTGYEKTNVVPISKFKAVKKMLIDYNLPF